MAWVILFHHHAVQCTESHFFEKGPRSNSSFDRQRSRKRPNLSNIPARQLAEPAGAVRAIGRRREEGTKEEDKRGEEGCTGQDGAALQRYQNR